MIRFNQPHASVKELEFIADAIASGHTSSGGRYSEQVVDLLGSIHGGRPVLLTPSCTAGLELSALLLDIEPGDTVIVPSFTFVTSALAFVRAGARIVFADIEPTTLGLDPSHVRSLMDDSVRAVVAVHYAGIACDVGGLLEVLEDWPRASLIEDNAQGLFGELKGEPLGTFGRTSAISFHETKNFSCGEGGAVVLNDDEDVARAHVIYDKGTDRRAFMLGQVDKYSWRDTGSSFGMSNVAAAYLLAQLVDADIIQARRRAIFEYYLDSLGDLADEGHLSLPTVPEGTVPAYHLFYVLYPEMELRDRSLKGLNDSGIGATFHFVPLHSSDGGRRFSASDVDCPVTTDVAGRLLRLPFHTSLTDADLERVVEGVRAQIGSA